MRSPVYALIWEQWRQVRVVLALCVLATILVALTPSAIFGRNPQSKEDVQAVCNVICTMFICAALLLDYSHGGYAFDIPRRTFTLPVPRMKLVIVQYLFRLVFIAGASVVLTLPVYSRQIADGLLSGTTFTNFRQIDTVLMDTAVWLVLLLCFMSTATAVAWSVGRKSLLRGIAALLIVPIPLLYAVNIATQRAYNYYFWRLYFDNPGSWEQVRPTVVSLEFTLAVVAGVVLFISATVAFVSVSHADKDHSLHLTGWQSTGNVSRRRFLNFDGQIGFELRNSFFWYPTIAAAVALLSTFSKLVEHNSVSVAKIQHWCEEETPGILLLSALATGLFILVYDYRKGPTQTMLYTRPVATASLACSRFQVSLASTLMVAAIWQVVLEIALLADGKALDPSLLFATLALWLGAVTLMWVPIQAMLVGTWFAVVAAALAIVHAPNGFPIDSVAVYPLFVWAPCGVFAFRFCFVIQRVSQKGLANRALIRAAQYSTLLSLLPLLFGFSMAGDPPLDMTWWQFLSLVWMACNAATLPAYALLSHTLWLDNVRHGQTILGRQLFLPRHVEV